MASYVANDRCQERHPAASQRPLPAQESYCSGNSQQREAQSNEVLTTSAKNKPACLVLCRGLSSPTNLYHGMLVNSNTTRPLRFTNLFLSGPPWGATFVSIPIEQVRFVACVHAGLPERNACLK